MLISSENTRRKKCNFRRLFYSVTRDKPFVLWYIPASRFRAPAQPAEKPSPRHCSSRPSTSWKDGRVVDCTALERRHTEIPYRGFESLSFRQIQIRCCFMQHRIFYFLQKNPASTASLRLLESQKIAFTSAGVLAGNLMKNQYLFVLHGQERVLSRCTQKTANSKLSSVPRLVTKLVR